MLTNSSRESLQYGLAVAAVLVLGWFLYEPALGGSFLLDDWHNLGPLASVSDVDSALQFVLSGTSGPVGRPLALTTFAPQAALWGQSAGPFILVNILIHLLNGLLTYYFFRQLARARGIKGPDNQFVAIAAMALWLFMPLLASSTLMVIQRMTTLSATFMLIGLNAYLYFRSRMDTNPKVPLIGMSAALIVATLMAVLAKENGALLPALVLVLEGTLFTRPRTLQLSKWRAWQSVFLLAPTLAVVVFLIMQAPYSDAIVLQKDFTAWERLLTEAGALWEYLFNAFVARPNAIGPFHDSYAVSASILDPLTLIAVVAWLSIIAAAIRWRRRYSVASLAVLWFVTGHLLESTTVPLYLYFEHRNYIPMLGPVFAFSFLTLQATGKYRGIAQAALPFYVMVNAGLLYSVTSLWGNPPVAAGYWHLHAPDSAGAISYLARQQMSDMQPQVGALTLRDFASKYPTHDYLRLPALTVSCQVTPHRDHEATVEYLKSALPSISYSPSVGPMLDDLLDAARSNDCNGVDREIVKELTLSVYGNPRYASNKKHSNFHHQLLAKIARNSGDVEEAIRQLTLAKSFQSSDDLSAMFVSLFVAERRFEEARQYIHQAGDELPLNPLKRFASQIMLRELRRYVDDLEAASRNTSN